MERADRRGLRGNQGKLTERQDRRFHFRLALALGMTVKELLGKTDARELMEWRAYCELEPFGQDRADAGAAMVAYTVATVNGVKNVEPSDFLPRFGGNTVRRETGERMLAKAKAFVARFKALSGGRK